MGRVIRRSGVGSVRLLQHPVEDAFLDGGKRRVALRAGPGQVDALVQRDAPVLDQDHPVGQGHRLLHVVRHQQRGEAVLLPQAFDQAVHLDAGQRVQRTQWLVQQQQPGLVHQRTGQGHALALAAGQACRPFVFALGQADIDIRYGIPQWGDLVVEPLFEEAIVPLASPAFIKAHKLKRAEQLLDLPLIQSNVSIVQWSDWFGRFTKLRAPDRFSLRFDRAQMSLDAATQGLGVALESAVNAGGHLADGRLKAPFGMDQAVRVKAHFAVYPERHAKRPAVEAFLSWLHSEAAQT